MVSGSRFREQFRTYRKVILQNWNLFRASGVGVIGLAVLIGFVLMAVLAPFLNLRDPIRWTAPSQDVLSIDVYWNPPLGEAPGTFYSNVGPVTTSPALRVAPAAFGARTDRLYVAAGTRLLAIHSWAPEPAWQTLGGKSYVDLAVLSNGTVSASPVVANFGDFSGSLGDPSRGIPPKLPEYFIYVGMSDGRFLVYRDSFNTDQISYDSAVEVRTRPAQFAWSYTVDGAVTSIAVFNPDQAAGRTGRELVAAATDQGKVYLFRVGAAPRPPDRSEIPTTPTDHTFLGVWSAGRPMRVNLADGPMRPQVPMWSPAFSRNGTRFVVGTADGVVHLLNSAGIDTEVWNLTVVPGATAWRGTPVINAAESGPPHRGREIVLAPGVGGWIFPRYLSNKTVLGWDVFPGRDGFPDGGVQVNETDVKNDTGAFGQPVLFGKNIFVASTSGCIYSIRFVGAGTGAAADGTVQWRFCEELRDQGLSPQFTGAPVTIEGTSSLVIGASLKVSPSDTTLTDGTFYSLRFDTGELQYTVDLEDEAIPGRALSFLDPEHISDPVWFIGTGPDQATIYSYSTTGSRTTPSEPSWAHLYDCSAENGPGARCPGYRSGNAYWLGLDSRGRDIFSQLIWGSRIALLVGFLAAFFTVLIGMVIGLVAGYLGGRIDSVLMRFTDVILVIPGLPLIIIMASVLGSSIWNIILVIALVGWPGVARVIRAEVLSLKERPFIESARVTGAGSTRIMFRHVAPNVMPLAFLFMTFGVSGAILSEAALSFIGLGDVNTMSWGIMLYYVQNSNALKAWWWLLPPGLAITMISLSFFLVGRAFDEIVNPRLRKR